MPRNSDFLSVDFPLQYSAFCSSHGCIGYFLLGLWCRRGLKLSFFTPFLHLLGVEAKKLLWSLREALRGLDLLDISRTGRLSGRLNPLAVMCLIKYSTRCVGSQIVASRGYFSLRYYKIWDETDPFTNLSLFNPLRSVQKDTVHTDLNNNIEMTFIADLPNDKEEFLRTLVQFLDNISGYCPVLNLQLR